MNQMFTSELGKNNMNAWVQPAFYMLYFFSFNWAELQVSLTGVQTNVLLFCQLIVICFVSCLPDIETVPPDLLTLTSSCVKLRMTQQPPLHSTDAGTHLRLTFFSPHNHICVWNAIHRVRFSLWSLHETHNTFYHSFPRVCPVLPLWFYSAWINPVRFVSVSFLRTERGGAMWDFECGHWFCRWPTAASLYAS